MFLCRYCFLLRFSSSGSHFLPYILTPAIIINTSEENFTSFSNFSSSNTHPFSLTVLTWSINLSSCASRLQLRDLEGLLDIK